MMADQKGENMTIRIPQEKYPIEPVRKALKSKGFRYSKKESCFIGKVMEENKTFLKLLGYL